MGTRLTSTPPSGDFTNFCWTTGAFFNPANPPKFVSVNFAEIKKGSLWVPGDFEPPNQTFILEQADILSWVFIDSNFFTVLGWTPVQTQIFLVVGPPVSELAFDKIDGTCLTTLTNSFTSPAARHYYDGIARVLGVF